MDIPEIATRVEKLKDSRGGKEVHVLVIGPRGTPMASRNIRARARALAAAGIAPTLSGALEDLTVGEIKALTRIEGEPREAESGKVKKSTLHKVIVNRD